MSWDASKAFVSGHLVLPVLLGYELQLTHELERGFLELLGSVRSYFHYVEDLNEKENPRTNFMIILIT